MKNITIETNFVRVIGNTTCPTIKEMNEMIGKEYEVDNSDYTDDTIYVWKIKNKHTYCFNKKDVRFLTAGMHKNKHIAIDDEVLVYCEWKKVVGFYMYDGTGKILTGTLEYTQSFSESYIKDHRTEAVSLSGKEVDVIVDGVTYKAKII